jgi:hypothetical protein
MALPRRDSSPIDTSTAVRNFVILTMVDPGYPGGYPGGVASPFGRPSIGLIPLCCYLHILSAISRYKQYS